ncbi:MAG: beta-galactosidase [Pirellulales bacterium]
MNTEDRDSKAWGRHKLPPGYDGGRRSVLKLLALSPFCLDRVLHAQSPTASPRHSEVVPVDGVPTLVVDGVPMREAAFETYGPQLNYFQQFAQAGTRVFSFSTNAAACDYGHSQSCWVDPATWDYAQFTERAGMVLAAQPEALLLPRVNLGTPTWWLNANPREMELFADGTPLPTGNHPTLPPNRPFPSFASNRWRQDIGHALERLIQHVSQSQFGPHVVGWLLSGGHTEEWYHWSCNTPGLAGYSDPTRDAFQSWLATKYGDDQTLQTAWNDSRVTLTTAKVPSELERKSAGGDSFRDPTTQMNVIDFYLFWNELLPDTIDYFAQVAKRASDGQHVVGAFYGYLYEFAGEPEFGHNAVSRLIRSPHIDFMAVTASYFHRQSATGSDYQRSPAASLALHGKLWHHDNDVVSYRARELMSQRGFGDDADWTRNQYLQLQLLGYTETPEKTHWMYRRGWGFAVCHAMHQAWFDLHGGYFDAPDLMHEIQRLNALAADPRLARRHSIAEILIVADERSCAYTNPRSRLLAESLSAPQNKLTRLGAPSDHVLLDDLHLVDPGRYRLILFLNCYHVDDRQRAAIAGFQRDNRHLVWLGAPGLFNGHTRSLERMKELTGFPFHSVLEDQPPGRRITLNEPDVGASQDAESSPFRRKPMGNWTSYYSAALPDDAAALRNLAQQAKVHLFVDTDDALSANASLVVLHARTSSERLIRFPEPVHVTDLIHETTWRDTREVRLHLQEGETCLLHWFRSS